MAYSPKSWSKYEVESFEHLQGWEKSLSGGWWMGGLKAVLRIAYSSNKSSNCLFQSKYNSLLYMVHSVNGPQHWFIEPLWAELGLLNTPDTFQSLKLTNYWLLVYYKICFALSKQPAFPGLLFWMTYHWDLGKRKPYFSVIIIFISPISLKRNWFSQRHPTHF